MKHCFCLLACLWPLLCGAVTNLKLNGQQEITVAKVPTLVIMTCDLAKPGNRLVGGVYGDFNENGGFDPFERNWDWRYGYLIDGIGWITDPTTPLAAIMGDETDVDGKLRVTFPLLQQHANIWPRGNIFIHLKDEDGTEAQAVIHINIPPVTPMIKGRITSTVTGNPISGINLQLAQIVTSGGAEFHNAYSDKNGEYAVTVKPGTWQIMVLVGSRNGSFKNPQAVTVTVAAEETVTQNFSLASYGSFIQGFLKKKNNDPVAGAIISAMNYSDYSNVTSQSDSTGYYKLGVNAGKVLVRMKQDNDISSVWPLGYYTTPSEITLDVNAGQTVTQNFTFEPYTGFVEGACLVDGQPADFVRVHVEYIATQGSQWGVSEGYTDINGRYHIGVRPGSVTNMQIFSINYEIVSSTWGNTQFAVAEGQTVTGKDFTMRLYQGTNRISGKISNADGSPATHVYVVAVEENTYFVYTYLYAYTDQQGRFEFNNLVDGNWRVGGFKKDASIKPNFHYHTLENGKMVTDADFTVTSTTAVPATEKSQPASFHLYANHPNPFNPQTIIQYRVPEQGAGKPVRLSVSDLLGRELKILVNEPQPSGEHRAIWDGFDNRGQRVASGVYFYTMAAENYRETRKMVLAH